MDQIINWLLEGDVAIQFQTNRDLLDDNNTQLRERIASEGWGAQFLSFRREDGHWGRAFYQPKWTSTHYTLLDLKHLNIAPDHEVIRASINQIARDHKSEDGGINPHRSINKSDVCINGMFLNYACYFQQPAESLGSIVDFIIEVQMTDGGFNCQSNFGGAVHSSLHSTVSVLEGLFEYRTNGYTYLLPELVKIEAQAQEFILQHRLYRSDKTGEIIDKRFLMLSFPSRWYYDNLRALDYFQSAGRLYDPRMQDALDVLLAKRRQDNRWPLQNRHPGQTHFEMEQTGGPSRWNTLRALRVFKHFGINL